MQVASNSFLRSPEVTPFLPLEGAHSISRMSLLSTSTQKSTDISLVTAQGDKVTLSAHSALQAGYASYDYHGRLQGTQVSIEARAFQVSTVNSFSLSVEGDLNKDELADIKELVSKIDKLGSDFFSRPLEDTLAHAPDLGALDSIASFAATFQYSHQVQIEQRSQESESGLDAAVAGQAESLQNRGAITKDSVNKFINDLLKATQDEAADKKNIAEKLPKALAKLFQQLHDKFQLDEPKGKLIDHVQEKFLHELKRV